MFLPVPRELQRELDRAKNDIERERYVDAITRLNLILDAELNQQPGSAELAEDYFLPSKEPNGAFRSLKAEAERLIGTMPEAGLEAYELAYGTDARYKLDEAISKRDIEAIVEVSRKFAHTKAGQEATLVLGRERLAEGRFLESVMHLQRLANSEVAAKRFGRELVLLLAVAQNASGQESAARRTLSAFRSKNPKALEIEVAGKPAAWLQPSDDVGVWLQSVVGKVPRSLSRQVSEYQLVGGNAQRNADTNADLPIRSLRWELPLVIRSNDAEQLDRQSKAMRDVGAIPVSRPLVVGDWVLYRTANHLLGAELETGSRVWQYPWHRDEVAVTSTNRNQFSPGGSRYQNMIKKRVWSDALYGHLSSDGKVVYALNQLNGEYYTNNSGLSLTNELVALELERQGYTLWRAGGSEAAIDDELAGVFFLGAPLPVGDELYCIAEQNSEIRLLVLDKRNGQLVWSQQLAQIDPRFGNSRGTRRMSGVSPSVDDKILVCPTSLGGIVAVDIERRTLLWGHRYAAASNSRIYRTSGTGMVSPAWREGGAVIDDGKVVLTPWDSREIFCLDLLTGKPVWKNPRIRNDIIFCGGIYDNKAIFVGKKQVIAINLETGRNEWQLSLRDGPSGVGIRSGSEYLLATTTPEMIRIDLNRGQIIAALPTEDSLGNLAVARDQIVSQNERKIRAFYQQSKLQDRVDAILAKTPNDPWALENKAVLLLSAGKRDEGLELLRKAISNYPANDPEDDSSYAKDLLVRTILDMLRTEHPRATDLAAEIEPLLDSSQSRNEFDRMMTINLRRKGQLVEAFQRNLRLYKNLRRIENRNVDLRANAELMQIDRSLSIRHERWHRALFRELWTEGSLDQQNQMASIVNQQIESTEPGSERTDLVELLQDIAPTETWLLTELRQQVMDERTSPLTEARLLRLNESDDNAIRGQAAALLARLYQNSGNNVAAAIWYRKVADEYANEEVADELTGAQFFDEAIQQNETIRLAVESNGVPSEAAWNYGTVEVESLKAGPPVPMRTRPYSPYDTLSNVFPIKQEEPASRGPLGMRLVYNTSSQTLQGRDRLGNVRPIAMLKNAIGQLTSRNLKVRTSGHLIVAMRGESIAAVDALAAKAGGDEAILWQDSGGTTGVGARSAASLRTIPFGVDRRAGIKLGLTRHVHWGPSGRSAVSLGPVSEYGVVLRRYNQLFCLDPLNGETIWVRNDIDLSAEVWGDEEFVFVHANSENGPRNVRVFSTIDGSEHESHPIPEHARRVRMFGRYVLSWHYDVQGSIPQDVEATVRELVRPDRDVVTIPKQYRDLLVHRLQLGDILDRQNTAKWTKQLGLKSRATFLNDNEMAVFDPTVKTLEVFSVVTGETLLQTKLSPSMENIDDFRVERRSGLFIVTLVKYADGRDANGNPMFKSPSGRLTSLEVHAFNSDGESVWGVPAKLENFIGPVQYADDVPILVYLRRRESSKSGPSKRQLQTVILDARDGHAIHADQAQWDSQNTFQIRADRESQEIRLRLPARGGDVRLKFTNKPRSPSPPYGYEEPTTRDSGEGSLPVLPLGDGNFGLDDLPEDTEVDDLFR